MMHDESTERIRDRIRYWEGVRSIAQFGDDSALRAECRMQGIPDATPASRAKARDRIVDKANKRIALLTEELGKLDDGTSYAFGVGHRKAGGRGNTKGSR